MNQLQQQFVEAYQKHTYMAPKTDVEALTKELGYKNTHVVRTLILQYKKKGLIKDVVKR